MWQRERQTLGEELLEVWASNVVGFLDLDNLEDLQKLLAP